MSHLTHGLSVLVSVIRAGDDLRISFADTSSLKRGITQLKSDEASKSRRATVTFLRPRGEPKDPPIASVAVSSCPSGGSIGQAHTGYKLIAEPPADSQCHPCFKPRCFRVVDHQANIEDSLPSLRETEQVTRTEAIGPRYAQLSGRIANAIVGMIAAATGVYVRKIDERESRREARAAGRKDLDQYDRDEPARRLVPKDNA